MSNSRKLCICGKDRGKDPLKITVTTCHKNHPGVEGAYDIILSSPQNVCSSNDEQKDAATINKLTPPNQAQNTTDGQHDTTIQSAMINNNKNTTQHQHNNNNNNNKAEGDPPTIDQITEKINENNKEISENNETKDNDLHQVPSSSEEPEISASNDADNVEEVTRNNNNNETNDDDNDNNDNEENNNKTVVLMTETAVNTLPFLDRFFWPKDAERDDENNKDHDDDCAMELVLYEKHIKKCDHKLKNRMKLDNSFLNDGETFLNKCGRVSLPITESIINNIGNGKLSSLRIIASESSQNYKNLLKNLQDYFQDFAENSVNLKKYFSMTKPSDYDDSTANFSSDLKEIFVRKITEEKESQTVTNYFTDNNNNNNNNNNKSSKWYDTFLMCMGLKNEESIYEAGYISDELMPKTSSSVLVSRYLKI